MTIEDINECIFETEEKFGLMDVTINGIKVWQALRMHYYIKISVALGVYTEPHSQDFSRKTRWKNVGSSLKSALFQNPFFSKKNIDILVLDHPRKVKVGDEYIDIYTKYFIDDLVSENKNFEVLEMPFQHKHLTQDASYRKHSDVLALLSSLIRPFIAVKVDKQTEKKLVDASVYLNQRLGTKVDFLTECSRFAKVFASRKIWIDRLLIQKRPKTMYVVTGFAYAVWIQAAKEQGIETIELQHGTMSRYYIGYSFPNSPKGSVDVFADKLYVWNDYWKNMAPYPLTDENIVIQKFQHFEQEKEKFSHIKKDPKKIVVISQGTVTQSLAKLLLENSDVLKEYTILYKLHPGEFDRWEDYEELVKFVKQKNVTIIKDEYPLYELLASSKYLIGIYSTAVYEGLEFGCKVMVADVAGIEHVKPMIDGGYFVKITDQNIEDAIKKSDENDNS
ncbi:MAG: Unknown protein [uncultured Sulfurovum sp.]|uniref:Uncharacterized protein n=1 Tax=uncultured Sulfurovum sp. TaxID=269237 RepID=A0A6S6U9I2_9BACT|nr:MAG: Unknown protein [uncultured Sulfurovum sp.]